MLQFVCQLRKLAPAAARRRWHGYLMRKLALLHGGVQAATHDHLLQIAVRVAAAVGTHVVVSNLSSTPSTSAVA